MLLLDVSHLSNLLPSGMHFSAIDLLVAKLNAYNSFSPDKKVNCEVPSQDLYSNCFLPLKNLKVLLSQFFKKHLL